MATQPTLAQLMRLKQMQPGQIPDTGVPAGVAPLAMGEGAPEAGGGTPGGPPPTVPYNPQAPQPSLTQRVAGGFQGQPGGGAGGLLGRMASGALGGALGPTQAPQIEAERMQRGQLGGQALIEKMRLSEEDKRLQEMLAATGMRIGSQEQIAAGHDTTRLAGIGEQQAGAEQRTGEQITGRSALQQQTAASAEQRLQQSLGERMYEANLKASTEKLMGTMRIEAAKELRLLPPTQIRSMAYTAQSTMNEIPKGIAMVDQLDQIGELGPLAGRWNDLVAGNIGVGDPRFMQLREFLTLNVAAALRTHFGARGGQLMFDKFLENLNIAGQSPANIKAAMAEVADWFGGYVDMATQPGYLTGTPAPMGPGGPPAPGALRRPSGAPQGGQTRPPLSQFERP